jgi:1-acyl-sn-glycerol-3-phosphate acyltransferase
MATAPTSPPWLRALAGPAVRRWCRLDVEGAGRIPDAGPVIIAPTHRSYADIPALAAATPRPLTFLGSAHLSAIPLAGNLLERLGLVSVNRGSGDFDALRRCMEILDAGGALVVFPEGGRSRDGRVYRPRSGVARLAAASGCAVIPSGIDGTGGIWPPDHRPRLRGGNVTVRFGQPIPPPDEDPRSRRAFTDELHAALADLSDGAVAREMLGRRTA